MDHGVLGTCKGNGNVGTFLQDFYKRDLPSGLAFVFQGPFLTTNPRNRAAEILMLECNSSSCNCEAK